MNLSLNLLAVAVRQVMRLPELRFIVANEHAIALPAPIAFPNEHAIALPAPIAFPNEYVIVG